MRGYENKKIKRTTKKRDIIKLIAPPVSMSQLDSTGNSGLVMVIEALRVRRSVSPMIIRLVESIPIYWTYRHYGLCGSLAIGIACARYLSILLFVQQHFALTGKWSR